MADEIFNKWDQPESEDRLDLVFADKFKGYGAFKVRTLYRRSKVLATIISCMFVLLVASTPVILEKWKKEEAGSKKKFRVEAKTLDDLEEEKKEEEPEPEPPKPEKPEPVASQQYVSPTIDPNTTNEAQLPPPSQVTNPGQTTVAGSTEYYEPGSTGTGGSGPLQPTNTEPVTKVDVQAKFNGGEDAFVNFIIENFEYPERCREENINGYVKLRFVVDKDGRLSNISAIEETKSCPEFTAEAIRVLKRSPRWIPGQVNGQFIKSWREVPIKLSVE